MAPPPPPLPSPAEKAASVLIDVTQETVDLVLEKVRLALQDSRELSQRRQECFDGFARRPLGNENPNRSRFIAADVLTQIEVTYPQVMRQALSTSQKVVFLGPDPRIAKALKVKCQQIVRDQGAYKLYTNVIKGGLISITGTAKVWWSRVYKKRVESYTNIPEQRLQVLLAAKEQGACQALDFKQVNAAEVNVVQMPDMTMQVEDPATYDVKATFLDLEKSGPMIAYTPPEEFLVERGKGDINDRKGCGLVRTMTVGEVLRMQERLSLAGEPFFRNMAQAVEKASIAIPDDIAKQERENREALHFSSSAPEPPVNPTNDQRRKECQLVEWVDYVADSAGREVFARLWLLGQTCIRSEVNEEGIVPYPTWTPIPVPGLIHGLSVAELHLHEQRMRSMLGRGILDQVAFAIDKEVYTTDGADVLGLTNRYPGKVIAGVPGKDFVFGEPPTIDTRIYQALDWLTRESSQVGPGNPLLWGGQVDPREKTATGAQLRQRASLSRTDMVSMAFTEQFVVDLNNKLIYLLQQNLDVPCIVKVDGEEVELTRENIQGAYVCVADFGLDVDFDDSEFRKALAINADMMASSRTYPMLYPLSVVYETKKRLLLAAGERTAGELLAPPPEGMKDWFLGKPLPGTQAPPGAQAPPAAAPPGMDNAQGQGSAQPDTTMFGGPET